MSNLVTGIYEIKNVVTTKRYIGSTTQSFDTRWKCHRRALEKNKHHSSYLQRSWNKYGEDNFEFKILEYLPAEFCIQREQWWMDLFGSYNDECGYNVSPTAGSTLGKYHNDEAKKKMSLSRTGDKNHYKGWKIEKIWDIKSVS